MRDERMREKWRKHLGDETGSDDGTVQSGWEE